MEPFYLWMDVKHYPTLPPPYFPFSFFAFSFCPFLFIFILFRGQGLDRDRKKKTKNNVEKEKAAADVVDGWDVSRTPLGPAATHLLPAPTATALRYALTACASVKAFQLPVVCAGRRTTWTHGVPFPFPPTRFGACLLYWLPATTYAATPSSILLCIADVDFSVCLFLPDQLAFTCLEWMISSLDPHPHNTTRHTRLCAPPHLLYHLCWRGRWRRKASLRRHA